MSDFAPMKTEGIHEFWIKGHDKTVVGKIENIEFFETEDNEVLTFLTIVGQNKEYRVNLKSIEVWAKPLNNAA